MNHYKKLFFIFILSIMTIGFTLATSAHWHDRRFKSDYSHNWKKDAYLASAIRALRSNSKTFEGVLRNALDQSRYNGKRREVQINKLVKRFKNAARSLHNKYKRYKNTQRSVDEARRVLRIGSQLDRTLSRAGKVIGDYSVESIWREIEQNLRIISREYRIKYDGHYSQYNRSQNKNRNNRSKKDYRRNVRDLSSTILRLQSRSRRLEDRLENASNYDGRLKQLSFRLNDAIDALEDEYSESSDHGVSYREARRVIRLGEQIDREISATRVNQSIRREWHNIGRDLRIISRAYKIKYKGQNSPHGQNKKRDRRDSRNQRDDDDEDDDDEDDD